MLNMTYSRSFKSLNNLGALLVFSAFIETLEFFFQEKRPPFSMLNAKRFEIVYVLHHLYIMYSNVKTPMKLRNYQPVAWLLYQRVIDQSKADMFIKPRI
jgi:hypothetical protein